jgi:hypothetical protein
MNKLKQAQFSLLFSIAVVSDDKKQEAEGYVILSAAM